MNPGTQERSAWLLTLPAIILLASVAGYPLLRTFYYSFTNAQLGLMEEARWIGLENYTYLAKDPDWWRSVVNTVVFALVSVTLETLLGLILAMVLRTRFLGQTALRSALLVPWAIPAVVSARMWAWMFNDLYGIINEVLLKVGMIHQPIAWLASDRLALFTVVAVDVWKTTPFMALLLLAGLQGIPANLYEAARADGVSPWKTFLHITLPLLRPALIVAVIFRLLDALRVFDLPFVLTSNSRGTAVMSVYARQQLVDFQDVGYGSAASFLVFSVIAVIAIAYLSLGRRDLEGGP